MQTFLPYDNFRKSARVLDYRRLGKQRVECLQIINACINKRLSIKSGWINHPAVLMWYGYEDHLCVYMTAMIDEWIYRGYKNNMSVPWNTLIDYNIPESREKVWWLGNDKFHASHRSNLLRKDPIHYGRFGWREPNNLEYLWPV